MTIAEFDHWTSELLELASCQKTDIAINGLQLGDRSLQIKKIAFAVDASMASLEQAARWGAQILFVHHGFFWGSPLAITGNHFDRVKFAIENDLAVYAVHLPLDLHAELGNNAVMARELGLQNLEPFGVYRGLPIGWKGRFPEPVSCEDIVQRLFGHYHGINVLKFGKEKIETLGILSGGSAREVSQAVEEGLDAYLTGEPSHENYHFSMENGINIIAAGHYNSEVFGVKAMARRINKELGIETTFFDIPTGL